MKEGRKVVRGGRIKRAEQEALRGGSACKKAAIKRPRRLGGRQPRRRSRAPAPPLALCPTLTPPLAPAYAHTPPPISYPFLYPMLPPPTLPIPVAPTSPLSHPRPRCHKEGSGKALLGWRRRENEGRAALLTTLLTAPLTARHGLTCDKRWGGGR